VLVETLAAVAFAFGREGGNIVPFEVTVAPSGAVHVSGPAHVTNTKLGPATMARLRRAIALADLPAYTNCAGTLPDVATQHVTAGRRTAQLHGACSAAFERDWRLLAHAVRLRF
jgi:hypothetical protein